MKFKNLYGALRMLGRFSEAELGKIESYMKVISLHKHAFLLQEGNTCQSIHFVEKGSLRNYYVDDSGADTTLNLFVETDWALRLSKFYITKTHYILFASIRRL